MPDLDDPVPDLGEVEPVRPVEDGAPVGPRVFRQVEARRVRLGEEVPGEAEAGQGLLEEGEVIDLLEADDVGLVADDLLEHPEAAGAPREGAVRALDEVVVLRSQGCGEGKKKALVVRFFGRYVFIWSIF